MNHTCRPSIDPRHLDRCACGRKIDMPRLESTVDRDHTLEVHLTELAAYAGGHTISINGRVKGDDGGLSKFASDRAHPGGVRESLDFDLETAEELADARNYICWAIQRDYPAYIEGESQASSRVERRMRALHFILAAWHALHTEAS